MREDDVYLIFQLLAFNVLLYALQEIIGVKICMSRRMPEKKKSIALKPETSGMMMSVN